MKKHKSFYVGFTIVELLIVIVIIAILAAITVIAYNGITTRAENTKTINSVSEYVKVLNAYVAENGDYPITGTACLGSEGTECGNTSNNGSICFSSARVSYRQDFATELSTIATSIPAPSTQTMRCTNSNGDVGMYGGAFHYYNSGYGHRIQYFLKGNQTCSAAGATLQGRDQKDDVTRCYIQLPVL